MKMIIGGDHAGYELKQEVIAFLKAKQIDVTDAGPFSNSSVDYPDFAHRVAKSVEDGIDQLGILICGSGNGVCITANKHQGVRAALAWNAEIAALARQHNNANVLCLPARFLSTQEALDCVNAYLNAAFEGGRHQARIDKIAVK